MTISPYTKAAGILIFAAAALFTYFLWTQTPTFPREDDYAVQETLDSEQPLPETAPGPPVPRGSGVPLSRGGSGIFHERNAFQDSRAFHRQNANGERVIPASVPSVINRAGALPTDSVVRDAALYGRVSRAALTGDYGTAADMLVGSGRGRTVLQTSGQSRADLRATIQRGFESIMRDRAGGSAERDGPAPLVESEVTRLMNDPRVIELGAAAGVGRIDLEFLIRKFLSAKAQQAQGPGPSPSNVAPRRYEPIQVDPR